MQRVLGSPGLHGSMRGVPAEMLQGSVRPAVRRRRGIERAARLTDGGSGRKFGACGLEVEAASSGKTPGSPAELLRCSAKAGRW